MHTANERSVAISAYAYILVTVDNAFSCYASGSRDMPLRTTTAVKEAKHAIQAPTDP